MPRNNAQIKVSPSYIPLTNLEEVDRPQDIWKGTVVENGAAGSSKFVYFNRRFDPSNDVDKMIREYTLPTDLLGIPCTLIPSNKILFQYEPTSLIQRVSKDELKVIR